MEVMVDAGNGARVPGVVIRRMGSDDLELTYAICRKAYSMNFAEHWEEGGLEVYLDTVFGRDLIARQLTDETIRYDVVLADGEPVGFMKLNLHSGFEGVKVAEYERGEAAAYKGIEVAGYEGIKAVAAIELDKLYVLPGNKGLGVGRQLMELAFAVAREMEKKVIWLAVLDKNEPAIAFYEKAGFVKTGTMRVGYPGFKEELRGMWVMRTAVVSKADTRQG